jgi:NADH-quinone oxidoreductase subunit L
MDNSMAMGLLILLPLIGFLINGFGVKKIPVSVSGPLATLTVAGSFGLALFLFSQMLALPAEGPRQVLVHFFDWFNFAGVHVPVSFVVDPISGLMILIITGVGSLIHLFSIGYMHHDEGATKYFAYLNLFIFNMLLLVLGENLLIMFIGWEGVGLCSYLLIGFWFKDSAKAAAGMKAFVANRVGDAGLLLGIFILFLNYGTLSFSQLNELAVQTGVGGWMAPLTLATLFLFVGATGKSAQIPLYVWLPDAMAGPTPVSALIHAATMVTAGVYMICRMNGVFLMAPDTLSVIAVIGAVTAVFAASIGLVQNDIKKVLAYSTVSQLGYMFLACGVGAFGAAMFHLMTHAFFKALMFLGSGSVIHGMHEEQDIQKMGGLKKYMPWTHLTFFIGWLAIIGVPPFAGFFSKDEILWMAFHSPMGHWGLWILGLCGAAFTAFYMTRLMALTFWGESRIDHKVHPHESSASMLIPLFVLAVLSAVAGWIGIPHVLGELLPGHPENILEGYFHHVIRAVPNMAKGDSQTEMLLMGLSVFVAVVSAGLAFQLYLRSKGAPKRMADRLVTAHHILLNKYFVDEAYEKTIIGPLVGLAKRLWLYVDVNVIDRTTYVLTDVVQGGGRFVRSLQNGNLQQYAMYVALGLVTALTLIVSRG